MLIHSLQSVGKAKQKTRKIQTIRYFFVFNGMHFHFSLSLLIFFHLQAETIRIKRRIFAKFLLF